MQAQAVKRYASGHPTALTLTMALILAAVLAVATWMAITDSDAGRVASDGNRQAIDAPAGGPSTIAADRETLRSWYVPNAGEGRLGNTPAGTHSGAVAPAREGSIAWQRFLEANTLPGDAASKGTLSMLGMEYWRLLEANTQFPTGTDDEAHYPRDRGPARF